jgi:hypothetical protein
MSKKVSNTKPTSVNAPQTNNGYGEQQPVKVPKYVVIREGYRVSDKDYPTQNDPAAIAERNYWQNIATNWSYGERVQVVQYDSKRHRVW